jgi:hypothetical protein
MVPTWATITLPALPLKSDNTDVTKFRDWFEFAIPSLSGESLVSATLSLNDGGHSGNAQTFAIYGLSGQPLAFADVTTSNPFGSVATNNASSGTTVTIQLDPAALAAIAAAQGGNLFIGGIDSGENVANPASATDFVGDFEETHNGDPDPTETYNTVLNLTTSPASVPEPSSVALLVTAAFGAGLVGWRRKIRA